MNASSNSAPDDVENAGLDMVVLAAAWSFEMLASIASAPQAQ